MSDWPLLSLITFLPLLGAVVVFEDGTAVRADVMRPFVGVVRPLLDWKNTLAPSQE